MGSCVSTSRQSSSCCCIGIGKRAIRTHSDHAARLQQLSSIPNRIIMNGNSTTSCVFTQQGRKGINQDAMIVWDDFMPEDVTFCGVFDGHGPNGHLVARRVRDVFPLKLLSFFSSHDSKSSGDREEDKLHSLWRDLFLKSYKAMDKELSTHPSLDCFCSGSTSITLLKQGSNLFMGYIGDSRAVMGSKDENDSMVAIQLTVDLKPDLPREAERIKSCKGRVFALQDEPEVSRVWLPFDDAPGLAMARAFGDFCLKDYGVISIPEFSHRILNERDIFVVLASDGVWDVLSNEEVVQIVSSSPTRSSAARTLVESAAREWKFKYPTSKMDDCAVVCLFLDGKMDSESDNEEHGFSSATHDSTAIESDDGQQYNSEPCLQRNFTVRSSSDENDHNYKNVAAVEDNSGDLNWLGLEGVTRVNSLVQLPRFSEERPTTS
ncbi:probable protein phosphatase 2C 52 [Impatiens glandulifera]|uniref:probable protein phosphatase 2C 52 n=1 Tax=Impatiens glandulifera TaxID=253017 RepID=UPI001FB056A5|nr:probable protein phosphatase 2C 52 [Impatiens glandulifera]